MFSLRTFFLMNAVALSGATFLRAAVETAELPDTTVRAARETGSPTSPDDARAHAALDTSTGAVNFITADEIAQGRSGGLRDMLDYQPGVFIQTRNGLDESRLSIRGSGVQRTFHGRGILVMQDGLPMNLADGSFDMQNLDPAAYSRIRVWRGASSLTQGSGTLGGAIDFTSFTGLDAPVASLGAEGGSYGYARLTGTLSTAGLDSLDSGDAVLTATATRQDGWRDNSENRSERINSNVGVRLSENTENRLYLGYVNSVTQIPGSLTKAQLESDPRQAAPSVVTNPNGRNYEWLRLADRVAADFDDARAEFAAGWQWKHLDHPIYQTLDVVTNDLFVLGKVDYTADLAGQRNRLTLGATSSIGFVNDNRYVNPPGSPERGAKLSEADDTASNVAVFAEEDHYFTKAFAATVGVRLDYARREHDVGLPGGGVAFADDRTKDYFGVSPSVGVRYEFDNARQQIFSNVSRSFEAPTFGEFNTAFATNPATVDAQTATTFEIGTRGERGAFGWDLAYYYAFMEDEFISSTVPNTLIVSTVNADDTRHQGVEAGFDANLFGGDLADGKARQLVLRQVLAWNDFRFAGDRVYGNNRIAGIPELTYRAELVYRHPSGFYIGPNIEVASRSWVDHANTQYADAYIIAGARAGYRRDKGFGCYVELRNLFDTKYAATTTVVNVANAATAAYNPGDGFGVYAGVSYKW